MRDKRGFHKVLADTGFPCDEVPVTAAVFRDTKICRNILQTDSASFCSPFVVTILQISCKYVSMRFLLNKKLSASWRSITSGEMLQQNEEGERNAQWS
jgi:hypothetical protein